MRLQTLIHGAARTFALSLGLTAALAAPTAQAAYVATAVPFAFEDIAGTGTTRIGAAQDDVANGPISLGFNFTFFGVVQTSIHVSSNGLLTFGSGNASFSNGDLTVGDPAQAAIAPYWDDLHTRSGAVLTQTVGAPGARRFIAQWQNVSTFVGNSSAITFQAVLFEGSNDIRFNYLDLVSGNDHDGGASATVGIKDAGDQGPNRLLLSFNTLTPAFVGDGKSILIQDVATTVPLPASLALLGLGLAGLGLVRRRHA